eukprot:CAMPEP_0194229130 /NCGR_PEP_ID=MMETSP0156-20130528/43732_1 /TAXON_ID=33649 /ORGANISM="Thalassionema nitzschioides, Strain L26-B" /LENGTH=740 /DNA_ID=CAMNT_0038961669 /DNA_START=40 /DNA_END=2259 /DNA_ORIENTATION=-
MKFLVNIVRPKIKRELTRRSISSLLSLWSPNAFCSSVVGGPIHKYYGSIPSQRSHLPSSRLLSTTTPITAVNTREDFFGETISFLEEYDNTENDAIVNAYDQHLVSVLTKGKSAKGGGDSAGIPIQAAHSVAMVWADLLEHILVSHKNVPMLTVAAIAPILVQADKAYLRRVDSMLQHCSKDGKPLSSLLRAATQVSSLRNDSRLTPRERQHLEALHHLLILEDESLKESSPPQGNSFRQRKKIKALSIYLQLLRQCPGDALGLSLAMDLAFSTGQRDAALEIATICYSYWQDRRHTIPGYTIGASWIAVGLAAGGRFAAAEALLYQSSPNVVDLEGCSGIASWAMALVLDAEGRVAEGISNLKGYDGVRRFETAALLQFDSRLMGYGGRWALDREAQVQRDREEALLPSSLTSTTPKRGRTILRVYDNAFDRIFQYSGYSKQQPWIKPQLLAPVPVGGLSFGTSNDNRKTPTKGRGSLFSNLFGWNKQRTNTESVAPTTSLSVDNSRNASSPQSLHDMIDVFTWSPPTPQLLTDATFLLLRATLHGTDNGTNIVSANDPRWHNLRNAWYTLMKQYNNHIDEIEEIPSVTLLSASLVCHDNDKLVPKKYQTKAMEGAALLGTALGIASLPTRDDEDAALIEDDNLPQQQRAEWKRVVLYLLEADENLSKPGIDCWDLDRRPILEIAVCYAARKSQDMHALSLARAVCSKGVALRTNSPEEWHRYSTVLSALGDEQASEQA